MKIVKWIEIESQEVTFDVGWQEIREVLEESLAGDKWAILHALNAVGAVLNSFTDEHIAKLTEGQREVAAKALAKHAKRIAPEGPKGQCGDK